LQPFCSKQDVEVAEALIANGLFMRQLLRVGGHTMEASHHHEAGKARPDFMRGGLGFFRSV